VDFIPLHWLKRAALPALVVAFLLLVACLLPPFAHRVNGATRWISIMGITFQPAEIAKIALLLFLAQNLSRKSILLSPISKGLSPCLFALAILTVPMMLQPDFGSSFLLVILTVLMLFVAGLPLRLIAFGSALGLPFAAYAIYRAPYRLARFMSFLDPWAEAKGGGFQIIQSYLGFRNGGLMGQGLGESKQKLFFLPEAHTDFILSVVGEELGLVGVLVIIAAFVVLVAAGYRIAYCQKDPFCRYLAFGISSMIASQAALNLGVVMGLLPTKGIPLPFISNGSTCLLVFMCSTAVLVRLSKNYETSSAPDAR
jgi:cell division protein FtsW